MRKVSIGIDNTKPHEQPKSLQASLYRYEKDALSTVLLALADEVHKVKNFHLRRGYLDQLLTKNDGRCQVDIEFWEDDEDFPYVKRGGKLKSNEPELIYEEIKKVTIKNPAGPKQGDIAQLLRHAAEVCRGKKVVDLSINDYQDDNTNDRPYISVYYIDKTMDTRPILEEDLEKLHSCLAGKKLQDTDPSLVEDITLGIIGNDCYEDLDQELQEYIELFDMWRINTISQKDLVNLVTLLEKYTKEQV